MKLTKLYLKQLIKEEIEKLKEAVQGQSTGLRALQRTGPSPQTAKNTGQERAKHGAAGLATGEPEQQALATGAADSAEKLFSAIQNAKHLAPLWNRIKNQPPAIRAEFIALMSDAIGLGIEDHTRIKQQGQTLQKKIK